MPRHIIARFFPRPGAEGAMAQALRDLAGPTRDEAGCLSYQALRAEGGFVIHSIWADDAAIDTHAALPHTQAFLAVVQGLCDQPPEIERCDLVA